MDVLLAEVGDDENHPLSEVLDYLADHVKAYEDENFPIPEATPGEVLTFLMEQHGLKQNGTYISQKGCHPGSGPAQARLTGFSVFAA